MATVYEYDVKCVSAFRAYPKEEIQKVIEEALKSFECEKTGLKLESIEVKHV